MTNNYFIKHKVYNSQLYDELTHKSFNNEPLTEEENEYCKYCYHYEEYKAGLL